MDEYDNTPYGRGGDHCPWCAADWKRPHRASCPTLHRQCQYPPGCEVKAEPGKKLCTEHYDALYALLGPPPTE